MKRLFSLLGAIMLVVGLWGAVSLAGAAVTGSFPMQEQVVNLISKLELTPAQKTQAAMILLSHQGEAQEDFASVQSAVRDLAQVIRHQGYNEGAVRSAYQAVATAGEELVVSRAKLLAELRGILTDQQLAVLDEERQNMIDLVNQRIENRQALVMDWIERFGQ